MLINFFFKDLSFLLGFAILKEVKFYFIIKF